MFRVGELNGSGEERQDKISSEKAYYVGAGSRYCCFLFFFLFLFFSFWKGQKPLLASISGD